MRIAIRDDDLCAWSDYAVFRAIYDELDIPVSASIIPFAVANHGMDCMPYGNDKPKNVELSIAENAPLVEGLQKDISKGRVEVLLHGYSHEYDSNSRAELCWKAEERLRKELTEGKVLLERLFNPISVLVAPSQGINAVGIKIMEELKMHYSGSPNRLRERKITPRHIFNVAKRHFERLVWGRPCSVFKYAHHFEVPICALQPLEKMKWYFKMCKRHNWDLVVVVHYWRLSNYPEEMSLLREFVKFIKNNGYGFSFVSDCFALGGRA